MKLLGLLGGMRWQSRLLYAELENRVTVERLGLRSIFEEPVQGRVVESSRQVLREMSRSLIRKGAEGIVLARTELQMLLGPGDLEVPVLDTAALHVEEAVRVALETA